VLLSETPRNGNPGAAAFDDDQQSGSNEAEVLSPARHSPADSGSANRKSRAPHLAAFALMNEE
jgi:hypothetical protein